MMLIHCYWLFHTDIIANNDLTCQYRILAMLRDLLASNAYLVVPGTYDALSALIAKQAGFKAVYMSGFGVAGSLLGKPDIGLVTAQQMIARASQIVAAAGDTPVIADGDNGYGDEQAVAHLVNAYEQAGVQCIQLEDQVSPKRCGHMDNKEVVDIDEFPDTVLVANMVEDGKTPELTTTQLAELGYQLILRPVSALLSVAKTLQLSYESLTEPDPSATAPPRLSFQAYNELVGLADYE